MSVSVLLDGEESSLEFLDVHAQVARFFSTSHFFFSTYSVQIHMIKNCNIFFLSTLFPLNDSSSLDIELNLSS